MGESDPFSSLERGHSKKVGPQALEKLLQENKVLRQDKDVLTQKLARSKSALQETLMRLSKSNIQKAGQVSPSVTRKSPPRGMSERGISLEKDVTLEKTTFHSGTKPRSYAGGISKSKSNL